MKNSHQYESYAVNCRSKRLLIVTDIHHCHLRWHDAESSDRMELLCKCLNEEYQRQPYDAILSLGDYSLDFWAWCEGGSYLWETPVSHTDAFVKKYLPLLPTDFYMIAGNHEQYGEEAWRRITGRPREYAVIYGDHVFVMLDTFAGKLDPKENHDGYYTGINSALLSQVLQDHPDKKIFLCAHDLQPQSESEASRRLVFDNANVVCAFTGHTHRDNTLILSDRWRRLPVFYCGDFSYNAGRQKEKNWGYRILDLSEAEISTEYVRI